MVAKAAAVPPWLTTGCGLRRGAGQPKSGRSATVTGQSVAAGVTRKLHDALLFIRTLTCPSARRPAPTCPRRIARGAGCGVGSCTPAPICFSGRGLSFFTPVSTPTPKLTIAFEAASSGALLAADKAAGFHFHHDRVLSSLRFQVPTMRHAARSCAQRAHLSRAMGFGMLGIRKNGCGPIAIVYSS